MKPGLSRILTEMAAVLIRTSGIPFLVRHTIARRRVGIIVYHDPRPEILDRHLGYLSREYTLITLDQLVDVLYDGNWASIPPRSLVLTFDDGHAGNFRLLEVFKKYRVRPTLFLCSGIIGTDRHFWFKDAGDDARVLKRFQNLKRLEYLKERFEFDPLKEYPDKPRQALDKEQVTAMAAQMAFGAHSCFHPILTTCSDPTCWREIRESKEEIDHLLTGTTCKHFAFPNGDYGKREIAMVEEAGYRSARTTDIGWNDPSTDPFRLKIVAIVEEKASVNVLIAQLSGLTGTLRALLRRMTRREVRGEVRRTKDNNRLNNESETGWISAKTEWSTRLNEEA